MSQQILFVTAPSRHEKRSACPFLNGARLGHTILLDHSANQRWAQVEEKTDPGLPGGQCLIHVKGSSATGPVGPSKTILHLRTILMGRV